MNLPTIILVADDDPAGRATFGALLHSQGYRLIFAEHGAEALRLATEMRPDIILLDVMMPEMDGFEVCRRLRADTALAEVPILLVTALDDRDSRLAGLEAGADDFVSKPFDRAELRARIRSIARLNRYRRLVAERARFERMIELSPNGLMLLDATGSIHLANSALRHMLGVGEHEAIGGLARAFIASAMQECFDQELQRVLDEPGHIARFESMLAAQGGHIPVGVDAGYIEWDGAPGVQVSVRDISERKRAEAYSRNQIERLTALRAIDNAIASSLDLNVTLNVVLDQALDHLQVHAAAVLLRRPYTQTFEYTIIRGYARHSLRNTLTRLGDGFGGQVVAERRMLTLHDIGAQHRAPIEPLGDYYGVPLIVKGQVEGVLEIFNRAALDVDDEWLSFLEMLAGQAAIAIDHAALFESMQRAHAELSLAYTSTLEGWARALELRDKETEGHAQRVTGMTLTLAKSMGVREADLIHIQRGALLHDIGKMGIPDNILLKPGPLTAEEWQIMRQHPVYAYNMLAPIAYLQPALDIPHYHHEKWDGTGYPRGLKGEEIPLAARIFAVVDVWDALRFDRPYRKGWSEERVREHIRTLSGTHFDPRVVEAFLTIHAGDERECRLAVLVVDDEQEIISVVRRLLEDTFTVFTATSGAEALEILGREQIAVLLADQRMPLISGIQLLERAKYVSPATLGILCSGFFDHDVLTNALNMGNIRGYIHKPWNIAELRRRVQEVAQQYRAIDQHNTERSIWRG